MTEMREWWANVYAASYGGLIYGREHPTRKAAAIPMGKVKECDPSMPAFRIHVRLKPEGAPKRYASEANRRAWEKMPALCREFVECGCNPRSLI